MLAEVGGKAPREYGPVLANLPRWRGSSPFSFAELTEFYRANGAGLFARHRAFLSGRWGALPGGATRLSRLADEMLGYGSSGTGVIIMQGFMLEEQPGEQCTPGGDGGTGKSRHGEEPAHPARL
ncbi:MAG: hypothetical protein ACLRWQ_24055 [Flavonifractor plautii]